jgi:hypothetical protein
MSRTMAALTWLALSTAAAAARADEPLFPALARERTPRAQLERRLTQVASERLAARALEVEAIASRAALEGRRPSLRSGLLGLFGGLPSERGPLAARVTGRIAAGGFSVEKVIYESLPGFHVTANLYLPGGGRRGPFPAVLASVGHGPLGKAAERTGPDLARQGIAVLAIDPLGQGERLQHHDPELRTSRAGGPTDEHSQAAARVELLGESVARYFVWDAVRGLDYLESRPEIDRTRLGAAGCSGGGTVTTYLAAFDERVKAAAIACFITTWRALLEGPGPQEAEQTLAGFVAGGHDMGDYLALIAPRPLLILSTEGDFFPLAGARAVYQEARRLYGLLGAEEQISMVVSPGGHGNPRPGREAMNAFFLRVFAGGRGDPREPPDARRDPEELECTETGQLATSLRGRTVADLARARAAQVVPRQQAGVAALAGDVARLAAIQTRPGSPPPAVTVHRTVARPGYRLQVVSLAVEAQVDVWGLLALPDGAGRKPALILYDTRVRTAGAALEGDLDQRARRGEVVLALEPRGTPVDDEAPARPGLLGSYGPLHRRAVVVGRTLVGLRAEDLLRATDYLATRSDVDSKQLAAYAYGPAAVALLHAALLDPRLRRVGLEEMPVSYRAVIGHPIHRNLPEYLVPAALTRYDLPDLMRAVAARGAGKDPAVVLVNPVDAVGQPLRRSERGGLPAPSFTRRARDPLRWR